MILLLIVLILLGFGGFGSRYPNYGPHIGIGAIVLIIVVVLLLSGRL